MRPISVKFKCVFKYLHQIQYIQIGCKTRGSKEPVSLSCIFHNANVLENHNYKELTHNFSYVHVFVNLILLLIFFLFLKYIFIYFSFQDTVQKMHTIYQSLINNCLAIFAMFTYSMISFLPFKVNHHLQKKSIFLCKTIHKLSMF